VLAEQVEGARRDEIDAVVDRHRRRHPRVVEPVLGGDEAAVHRVAEGQHGEGEQGEQRQRHRLLMGSADDDVKARRRRGSTVPQRR
jgi:hypothetical protein